MKDDLALGAAPPAPSVLLVDFVDEQGLTPWQRDIFALACRGLGEQAPRARLEQLLHDALHGRI